jgi:hypothetical protein
MKATHVNLHSISFIILFVIGMIAMPMTSMAQEEVAQDTVEAIQDNSSSFNDSVQFDDMEPIFYEATEDTVEPATESGSSIVLYAGIAVVLLIILIVLKKMGKKKKT